MPLGTRPCTLIETAFYPLAASAGGTVLSYILLRRQIMILDPEGIRRRTGRREKLVRWADMSLIAEFPGAGKRYPPAIVIKHGIGRLFYIYDSTRISGRDLFRTINHYVTTHSIKVVTRALWVSNHLSSAVVVLVLSAGTVCAWVPIAASASAQTMVRLVRQPGIATGVTAFPRLAPGGAPAAAINDALSAADARVRTAAAECRTALAASHPGPGRHAWTRRVTVTMRGPRYLALLAEDDADCGGLYPNADRFALVYDLQTGQPPNWARLLPNALVRTVSVETGLDETPIGMVDGPALKSLYLAQAGPAAAKVDDRCVESLQQMAGPFALWPDARQGGLVVQPLRLPHAMAACGVPALLGVAALRWQGVQPSLLDAIGRAHQDGRYGMPLPSGPAQGPVR